MKNIYNLFIGKNGYPNCLHYISHRSQTKPINPVVLVFDNEQKTKRPLNLFLKYVGISLPQNDISMNIHSNLYLLTNPLAEKGKDTEIEDLFEDKVLEHKIEGKTFCSAKKIDINKHYGKVIFSRYVAKNYKKINFSKFKLMLDELNKIVINYHES